MSTHKLRFALLCAIFGALLVTSAIPIGARNPADLRPAAYAIRDARVVGRSRHGSAASYD